MTSILLIQYLRARVQVLGPLQLSVDGGAGWGDTAKTIAEFTAEDGVIYAFEPFPGNHRFFDQCDPRIKLVKSAISDSVGTANFLVPQIVESTNAWADKGLVGYSSVGYLTNHVPLWRRLARRIRATFRKSHQSSCVPLKVNMTRIDQILPEAHIDFVKLDLQGAEYQALRGMGELLDQTDMLWIEFSNQPRLLDFLNEHGFLMFDTNYLCPDVSPEELNKVGLRAVRNITLSTSQRAILASRVIEVDDYLRWFRRARKSVGMMQTDLLAVNAAFLPQFMNMLGKMGEAYQIYPAAHKNH